jgi:hypothetical protein
MSLLTHPMSQLADEKTKFPCKSQCQCAARSALLFAHRSTLAYRQVNCEVLLHKLRLSRNLPGEDVLGERESAAKSAVASALTDKNGQARQMKLNVRVGICGEK